MKLTSTSFSFDKVEMERIVVKLSSLYPKRENTKLGILMSMTSFDRKLTQHLVRLKAVGNMTLRQFRHEYQTSTSFHVIFIANMAKCYAIF